MHQDKLITRIKDHGVAAGNTLIQWLLPYIPAFAVITSLVVMLHYGKTELALGVMPTASVVAIGIIIAHHQFRSRRPNVPHLSMKMELTRTPINDDYHVMTANLLAQNTGTGMCYLGAINWYLEMLSPYPDEDIVSVLDQYDVAVERYISHRQTGDPPIYLWPTFLEASAQYQYGDVRVEPGEIHQESRDFVIPSWYGATAVSATVARSKRDIRRSAYPHRQGEGWYYRCTHRGDVAPPTLETRPRATQ